MKKRFIPLLLAVSMCLTALSGCAIVKGLEKDLQVVLECNGEYYGSYTVNSFNNAVVPEPEAPEGEMFSGWAAQEGGEPISSNKSLIRYDDVKDYIKGSRLSITLYAVFEGRPHRDLVIAWYAKSATSGIAQSDMDSFETKLHDFLSNQGYDPAGMDIVIRGYEGGVGDSCAAIKSDGDVDIMVGWSNSGNLSEKGGFIEGQDFLENIGGVAIGEKERYTARKTDTELVRLVYAWIQNEYGEGTAPIPSTEPGTQRNLVVAWYAKSATSGIGQEDMDAFQAKLEQYLEDQGYDPAEMDIAIRGYEGSVGDSCAAIQSDGDVDIMVGWSNNKNLTEKGGLAEGQDFLENTGGITIGEKERYTARKTDTELVRLVYAWIQDEYGEGAAPDSAKPGTQWDLVIAWYAKSDTSGIMQSNMDSFEAKLRQYLAGQGYDVEGLDILIRGYEGGVSKSCAAIQSDGDVDIMVGWSNDKNLTETGGFTEGQDFLENIGGISIGGKERYTARKTNTELSRLVYAWIQKEYGTGTAPAPSAPSAGTNAHRDLVIAWYAKSDTSGIKQSDMDSFEAALLQYLAGQGYDVEGLDILIRGYEGGVSKSCAAIQKDGDVDIMVGWSSNKNLTETGGFTEGQDFLENAGGITIGEKERYTARKTDTELARLVYAWIQAEYGAEDAVPDSTAAAGFSAEPNLQRDLVIAWYAKSDTSGIGQEEMDGFEDELCQYLEDEGYDPEEMNIVIRGYEGNVGDSCAAIQSDGDVDIMVGWADSKNLTEKGGLAEGEAFLENIGGITIGEKERYTARKTDTDLSRLVYTWIQDEYGAGVAPDVPATSVPSAELDAQRDLVIAWYAKSATSGIGQEEMDGFEAALRQYLEDEGYDPEEMNIVIRGYEGNVGDSCAAIQSDDDVDIMVGWSDSKNLTEKGGFAEGQDFLENIGGITIGEKERYAARKTDTDLSRLVYTWIQDEYGAGAALDVPATSVPSAEPDSQRDLVIAWYAKSDTSGITQSDMDGFEVKLRQYLTSQGYDPAGMDILIRGYEGGVSDTCAAIQKDGDVDIMLGWSNNENLTEKGGFTEGQDFLENVGKIKIGSKSRYAARKTDTELSKLVYSWLQKEYRANTTSSHSSRSTPTKVRGDLVIAWYDRSASGITAENMKDFEAKLQEYLTEQGYGSMKVVIRRYGGDVNKSCAAIKKDGDVDIMVGWSNDKNLTETGGLTEGTDFLENIGGITIGEKDRYAALKKETELSRLVYTWIQNEYGKGESNTPSDGSDQKLVIAWYNNSNSGITEENMKAFEAALREHLKEQGYDPDKMEIVIRPYTGKVDASCEAIQNDGDVDIMVGWSSSENLTDKGGFTEGQDFLENTGGITIGEKDRYAALKTETELNKLVYGWIQEEYGNGADPDPEDPAGPTPKQKLVIAWYNVDTSGITAENMEGFETSLREHLQAQGYDLSEVEIEIRAYDGKVGESCTAIKENGDVDIMVGWSSSENLTDKGGFIEGTDFLENTGDIRIGEKDRYAARKTDTELSNLVYGWIQEEYGKDANPESSEGPSEESSVQGETADSEPSEEASEEQPSQEEVADSEPSEEAGEEQPSQEEAADSELPEDSSGEQPSQEETADPEPSGEPDEEQEQASKEVVGWPNSSKLSKKTEFVEGQNILENIGGPSIGGKNRYTARKTDTEVQRFICARIKSEFDT